MWQVVASGVCACVEKKGEERDKAEGDGDLEEPGQGAEDVRGLYVLEECAHRAQRPLHRELILSRRGIHTMCH